MKRVLMMAVVAMMTLHAAAQQLTNCLADSYTGSLTVTVDGKKYVQPDDATIEIEKNVASQNVTITLKNFVLHEGAETIPIGTITLPQVKLTETGPGVVDMACSTTIKIADGEGFVWGLSKRGSADNTTEGEDQPFDSDWIGPYLGDALATTVTGWGWVYGMEAEVGMRIENSRTFSAAGPYYNIVVKFSAGDDVPTAINRVAATSHPSAAYTLDGRRAASGAKGIVIVDGKKVVK